MTEIHKINDALRTSRLTVKDANSRIDTDVRDCMDHFHAIRIGVDELLFEAEDYAEHVPDGTYVNTSTGDRISMDEKVTEVAKIAIDLLKDVRCAEMEVATLQRKLREQTKEIESLHRQLAVVSVASSPTKKKAVG